MTVAELLTACYQDLGYDPAPGPTIVARLTRYLSEGYYHILSMSEFSPLRSGTMPFTSVSGQEDYGFPQTFVQIEQVVNITQNVRLRLMTQDQFRTIDPQGISTGTPTHYIPTGIGPVQQQPPKTHIWAGSDNGGDTMNVSVFGSSERGFQFPRATTALTGLTLVDIGGTGGADYVSVQHLELAAPAGGFVYFFGAMAKPATPIIANFGAGTYPAILRTYKVTFKQPGSPYGPRVSIYSAPATFTPSGTGSAASVARPALILEDETHWQVHGSANGTSFFQLSGDLPAATLSFNDTFLPANYSTLAASPVAEGTQLAVIPRGQLTAPYQQMRLWPTPSANDVYAVDGVLRLNGSPLTFDTPVLPFDFQLVLCDYARMREYEYRDDTRAAMAASMYAAKLKQMKDRIMDPPDYRPRVGRIPDRGSNLGPYFPRGRW